MNYVSKFWKLSRPSTAIAIVALSACSAGSNEPFAGNDNAPPVVVETADQRPDFTAGTFLHHADLSQTARLEFWDQGEQGVMISLSGHNEYDADKKSLLEDVMKDETTSVAEVYRRIRPAERNVPAALLAADARNAERLSGANNAVAPATNPARPQSDIAADPDTMGNLGDVAEPELPAADEAGSAIGVWFRDTFCSRRGHDGAFCLLDRVPDPYIQKTQEGREHVGTANTDRADIRYRTMWRTMSGIFGESWDTSNDVRVRAGHWQQYSWVGNTGIKTRRFRIDAWDSGNPRGPLNQLGVTWRSSSGSGSSCVGTGGACVGSGQCCLTTSATMCVRGRCANDPNPGSGCNWLGEPCCVGTTTATSSCSNSADPDLVCRAGWCSH